MRIKCALVVLLFIGLLVLNVPVVHADGENWLSGWTYRRMIDITIDDPVGVNYAVSINVTYDSDMLADFADIRFTDNDGESLLDYWLKEKTDSSWAYCWVEIADSMAATTNIYLYYGNTSVVSSASDGAATFPFFDDFEDGSFNTSLWTETSSGGSYSEANGYLTVTGGSPERIVGDVGFAIGHAFCMYGFNMTPKGVNKYIYGGAYDFGAVDFALLQSYNNADRYISYDTVGETTADGGWQTSADYEIHMILYNVIQEKFEYYENNVLEATHTETFDSNAAFNFEVTGAGTSASDKIWIDTALVRDVVDDEPEYNYTYSEEVYTPPQWNNAGTLDLILVLGNDPVLVWGLDVFLILAGGILIPTSTVYLVYGGRDKFSTDKLLIFLILFMVGIGLLIGGVMP